jgi:hypothetical protein
LNGQNGKIIKNIGNAANCPGSQLVAIFQLPLNVEYQLAEVFKLRQVLKHG